MKKTVIIDATIRETSLTFKEKLTLVRQLSTIGADVVELGLFNGEREDALLVKTVTPFVKNTLLSARVGMTEESVDAAWAALSSAKKARLSVAIPTSVVQMEYFCHAKPDSVAVLAESLVKRAATYTDEVEFVAEDATRSEKAFLARIVTLAIEAGAKYITLCDSEGRLLPHEFAEFINDFLESCPIAKGVGIFVECSNNLSMAAANSITALGLDKKAVVGVKTSLVGKVLPKLEAVVHIITDRGDSLGLSSSVDPTGISRAISSMPWLDGVKKPLSLTVSDPLSDKEDALSRDIDLSELTKLVMELGYDLTTGDISRVHKELLGRSDNRGLTLMELETVIAEVAQKAPQTYSLCSYIVTTTDRTSPMAQVEIEKDGELRHGVSVGDGPIDAAFLATAEVVGKNYELDDFKISSVTRGQEAMGEALVRLRSRGKLYSGSGISTDIVGAAIKAYINAINKITFDER